jgi:transcriptional regulator with XRE-family HTH domain
MAKGVTKSRRTQDRGLCRLGRAPFESGFTGCENIAFGLLFASVARRVRFRYLRNALRWSQQTIAKASGGRISGQAQANRQPSPESKQRHQNVAHARGAGIEIHRPSSTDKARIEYESHSDIHMLESVTGCAVGRHHLWGIEDRALILIEALSNGPT